MKTNDVLLLAGAAVAVFWLLNRSGGTSGPLATILTGGTRPVQAPSAGSPMTPPAWLGGEDFYYSGGA